MFTIMLLVGFVVAPIGSQDNGKKGAIVSLSSLTEEAVRVSDRRKDPQHLHTWNRGEFQLELNAIPGKEEEFQVRLWHGDLTYFLLETMTVNRLDGLLTQSITMETDFHNRLDPHVVRYLTTKGQCLRRTYTPSEHYKSYIKTEEDCAAADARQVEPQPGWTQVPGLSSAVSLATATLSKYTPVDQVTRVKSLLTYRSNGWNWIHGFDDWNPTIPGYWKGAILELQDIKGYEIVPPVPSLARALNVASRLHSWRHPEAGYNLGVYKVNDEEFYASLDYNGDVLEKAVMVSRFDDNLLNSVSVTKPSKDGAIHHHKISWKLDNGTCVERLYSVKKENTYNVGEGPCVLFSTVKFIKQYMNIDVVNGWAY